MSFKYVKSKQGIQATYVQYTTTTQQPRQTLGRTFYIGEKKERKKTRKNIGLKLVKKKVIRKFFSLFFA